jgi:hypothetical protein
MIRSPLARTFWLAIDPTSALRVVDRVALTAVVVAATESGASTSRLTCVTTNTSLSNGFSESSIVLVAKELARGSKTVADICIGLDVVFNPTGIRWVYPEIVYILLPLLLLTSTPGYRW